MLSDGAQNIYSMDVEASDRASRSLCWDRRWLMAVPWCNQSSNILGPGDDQITDLSRLPLLFSRYETSRRFSREPWCIWNHPVDK